MRFHQQPSTAIIGIVIAGIVMLLTSLATATPALGQLVEPVTVSGLEEKRVRFWLDGGWEKNLDNRRRGEELYQVFAPKSASVQMAYAVNRLEHNRSREADEVIDAALRMDPDNVDAQIMSIWIKTLRDDFETAVVRIRTFSQTIKDKNIAPDRLGPALARIGRILGYLQGPVGDRVDQNVLKQVVEQLAQTLDDNQRAAVADQTAAVMQDFEQRMQQFGQTVTNQVAEKEATNEVRKKLIEQSNDDLKLQKQQIQQRKQDVADEGEQKLDAAMSRIYPLQRDLATLSAQIQGLENTIRFLQTQLFFHLNDPAGSPLQCDLIRFQIQNNYFALNNLRSQADGIAYQINVQADAVARIRAQYGGELTQLERNLRNSRKEEKRNANRLVKIAKDVKPDAPKVSLLTGRITALSTYDAFPTELYRADFLRAMQ